MDDAVRISANAEGLPQSASLEAVRLFLVISGRSTDESSRADLLDMAARGELATRARTLFIDGHLQGNPDIPPAAWACARLEDGVDWEKSALTCTLNGAHSGCARRIRARDVSVDVSTLTDLIPSHVDEACRLVEMQRGIPVAAKTGIRSSGGRRADPERWKVFWFAVIELAQSGTLDLEHFASQAALRDELLTMMGPKSAFNEDHIRTTVRQIFQKFIERDD